MPIKNQVKSVFKSLNGLTPDYMNDILESVADVSVRSTRLSATNNLYVLNRKLCLGRRTQYSGANLNNSYTILHNPVKHL